MKIKGIKRGQTIELLQDINIPDGAEITVELVISSTENVEANLPLTDEEKLRKLNQLFGAWKDQPELTEIFAEIDRQRHAYRGRAINSIDAQVDS
ncbi:hypothetical protein ABN584_18885 [Gloeocapsa sp. BRSZ]